MASEIVRSRPTLIKIGSVLSPALGCLQIALAMTRSFGFPDALPLIGPPRGTWLFAAWNVACLVAGVLLVSIGYAFWKDLAWARPVVMVFWSLQALLAIAATFLTAGQPFGGPVGIQERGCSFDFTWIIGMAFAGWYFYTKPNVAAYYDQLERRARIGAAA